ncbi:MAG: mobile mystery protein B [Synechococcaceae bacterium WB6_3B_236]|nr:mobile mystery protein B [Synechococcaceae bacterium WB6_3B_236]
MNEGLPAGATSLDGEELEGLLPSHLVSRSQLNEWEQQNIEAALFWLSRQRRPRPLEEAWLRRLHREMFGQSWRWAGQYRSSGKSIGADWRQIRMQVPALLADISYQVEHRLEPVDQIAVRFHHRLVSIHPFPNGNGRHARLIADVLIEQLGAPRFSWGGSRSLVDASALRQQYIAALQQADRGDIRALLAFARAS